ncbi:MAG: AAA family ATPase [Bacteroidaceae bacterium]|nr:AAA family ATPase [Bacteroidaceae bacterium]
MYSTTFHECTDIPQDNNKNQTRNAASLSNKSDNPTQLSFDFAPDPNDIDDNEKEFIRMLEEYINSEYEKLCANKDKADDDDTDDDEETDNDDDEDTDDDTDEEKDDDTDSKEEPPFDFGSDTPIPTDPFLELDEEDNPTDDIPDDEFEIGNYTSVKVEILPPLKNPHKELNKLIGCKNIKQRIDELIRLTHYNKRRLHVDPKAKQHNVSLHGLFIGKPGTGKTTVCKIYGSLLHEAGVLSKGHVVVANRSTFVGNCWGDEEKAVKALIEKAQGGVLMIDEAYQLNSSHQSDPGKMVIPMFMDILADESKRDFAVILCGYKEEIESLIELNPGLHSRFTNTFEFSDFTFEELLDITRMRIKEYNYHFTPSAWEKYKNVLAQAYAIRNPRTWGNARFIANLLERIYVNHANRCIEKQIPDKRLSAITPSDIQSIEVAQAPRRMGFAR